MIRKFVSYQNIENPAWFRITCITLVYFDMKYNFVMFLLYVCCLPDATHWMHLKGTRSRWANYILKITKSSVDWCCSRLFIVAFHWSLCQAMYFCRLMMRKNDESAGVDYLYTMQCLIFQFQFSQITCLAYFWGI